MIAFALQILMVVVPPRSSLAARILAGPNQRVLLQVLARGFHLKLLVVRVRGAVRLAYLHYREIILGKQALGLLRPR